MPGFVYKQEYVRPEATRVSDGVVMRLQHVYEVDPDLMGKQFSQQNMPTWDTLRIVESRNEHLSWMHEHFADETLVAGLESEAGARTRPAERRGLPGTAQGSCPAPQTDPSLLTRQPTDMTSDPSPTSALPPRPRKPTWWRSATRARTSTGR